MTTKTDHFVEFDQFKEESLEYFLAHLSSLNGIMLSELKVSDLSYFNGKIVTPGEGVYLFRKGKEVLYVGKVSSMSFTERIGKHFDVREFAWFNRLLKLIAEKIPEVQLSNRAYLTEALDYALENCNLLLINFQARDKINKMETVFRAKMEPLNKFKHHRPFAGSKLLKDF